MREECWGRGEGGEFQGEPLRAEPHHSRGGRWLMVAVGIGLCVAKGGHIGLEGELGWRRRKVGGDGCGHFLAAGMLR